ncbi:MAG: radical SAM protein [Candidatus Lernaella stagnicola]|nr:radical SAM protein [Candidatus Lernaella stagnicola]
MSETKKDDLSQGAIFGPVPSRRLGMSLGVDVVPMKVCTFDCIYCELGRTTHKTLERREYVPTASVQRAMEEYFREKHEGRLDYVTFSGSGEPTLHSGIGVLIRGVKKLTDTPVAVLTNGSLLFDRQVRTDLLPADLVVPSLDAATQDIFRRVDQPAPGLEVSDVIWGLHQFSREFQGEFWLEVLLARGVNDQPDHVRKLADAARWINPTKIQLTTVVRPPGHGTAAPVEAARLHEIAKLFEGNVEVVPNAASGDHPAYYEDKRERIEAMLRIRPMTVEDIARTTGMHRNEVVKYLDRLRSAHTVQVETFADQTYYTIDRDPKH